jgi:hypothetical protein
MVPSYRKLPERVAMFTGKRLREINQWLTRRISLAEAEARYAEYDHELLAFVGSTGGWLDVFQEQIRSQMQPGDELWLYDTGPEFWEHLCGERGVALVRRGEVVSFVMEARS